MQICRKADRPSLTYFFSESVRTASFSRSRASALNPMKMGCVITNSRMAPSSLCRFGDTGHAWSHGPSRWIVLLRASRHPRASLPFAPGRPGTLRGGRARVDPPPRDAGADPVFHRLDEIAIVGGHEGVS